MTDPFDTGNIEDLWDELEQELDQLSRGSGGGTIAQVEINMGYPCFLRKEDGYTDRDALFHACKPKDEPGQKAAQAAAKKMLAEAGSGQDVRFGYQIKLFLDGAMSRGEPATWAGDRYEITTGWTDAAKMIVVKSFRENGIFTLPWKGWARVAWVDDPHWVELGKKRRTDQDGNPCYDKVAYISEIFDSKEDAYAAAGGEGEAEVKDTGWKPISDWTTKDLVDTVDTIRKLLADGQTIQQITEDYGLHISDTLVAFGVHTKEGPPNVVAGKYGVSVKDITAARKHGIGAPKEFA